MKNLEQQFRELFEEFADRLATSDCDQIRELVDANELGVAFENFCTQLFEWDAPCSAEQYGRIESIGKAMGISADYWKNLEST
jgi:hypothetical protein